MNAAWATSEHTQMSTQRPALQVKMSQRQQVRSRLARASQRTFCVDAVAEELEEVGIRTLGARTRAVQL